MGKNKIGLIKQHLRKKIYSSEYELQRHTYILMLYDNPGLFHEVISLIDARDAEEMFFVLLKGVGKFLPSSEEWKEKDKDMKIIGPPYQNVEYYSGGNWYLFSYIFCKHVLRDSLFYFQSDGPDTLSFPLHEAMIQQQVDRLLLDPQILFIYCYQAGIYYRMRFHCLENEDGSTDAGFLEAEAVKKTEVEESLGLKIEVPS